MEVIRKQKIKKKRKETTNRREYLSESGKKRSILSLSGTSLFLFGGVFRVGE